MDFTIEKQTALNIVRREQVAKILARTGGEVIHPDHYDLREAIRIDVLHAIDEATTDMQYGKMSDGELPELFKMLDAIAERVFLKKLGL